MLDRVDSYTILETQKIREIGRVNFASVLVARDNGEEFVLKEIFYKHWDQKRKEISKESQNFKWPENPKTHNQHQKSRL